MTKYMEIKGLPMYKLREACIDYDWYTCGDNTDYENLLTFAENLENVTFDDLEAIAKNILNHSSFEVWQEFTIKDIMAILNMRLNRTIVKIN